MAYEKKKNINFKRRVICRFGNIYAQHAIPNVLGDYYICKRAI